MPFRTVPPVLLFLLVPPLVHPAEANVRVVTPTIVVGFHLVPADPREPRLFPLQPSEMENRAPAVGEWEALLLVFTREPLVGAWALNVALNYDGRPGEGIDVAAWQGLTPVVRRRPGWPEAGAGNGCEFVWNRDRCWPTGWLPKWTLDGWCVQVACRLTIRVNGPDSLTLADPEPNVRPQETECYDEMHELDGTDSWSGVLPAYFGDPEPVPPAEPGGSTGEPTPVRPTTWSRIKAEARPQ